MAGFIKKLIKPFVPGRLILYSRFRSCRDPMIRYLDRFVLPGTVAVDIGAANGCFTYALSKLVKSHGEVITIDPIPEHAQELRGLTRGIPAKVRVEQCCLSSRDGDGVLGIPIVNNTEVWGMSSLECNLDVKRRNLKVRLCTLDGLLQENSMTVSFIKCDVEGHELDVLKGSLDTIRKHKPCMLIEIEQRHISFPIQEAFDFVASLGYDGYFLTRDKGFLNIGEFDLEKHQPASEDVFLYRPDYYNNFIFVPEGRQI